MPNKNYIKGRALILQVFCFFVLHVIDFHVCVNSALCRIATTAGSWADGQMERQDGRAALYASTVVQLTSKKPVEHTHCCCEIKATSADEATLEVRRQISV